MTIADYNKLTKNIVDNNTKSKNLVNKTDIAGFMNNNDFYKKEVTIGKKAELKAEQNKIIN